MNWETQDPVLFFVIVIMPLLLPCICNAVESRYVKERMIATKLSFSCKASYPGLSMASYPKHIINPAHPIMKKSESQREIPLSSGDSVFE